ncbi:MAG: cobalt-precorrin 5A hydrolase [Desulfuromonadaceae bacterium]|nr:cobalt-precorrin 5A hydrolase [Desulfuromonadaceae bacterium]
MKLAIVAITDGGAMLARRLSSGLTDADLYLPERFREDDSSRYFAEPVAHLLPRLFTEYAGLICIMATGIVVRVLAPQLRGKALDPAVVVCDEKGQFAISLLSGHLGGANALAEEIAGLLDGQAVITTATDVNNLPAWDEIARLTGMVVEPLEQIRELNGRLLRGEPIVLVDPRRRIAERYLDLPGITWCDTFMAADAFPGVARVVVTHRLLSQKEQGNNLLLRPRDLIVGIGCNRHTSRVEIAAAVDEELQRARLSLDSVAALATIDAKDDEPGLLDFARQWQLRLEFHSAAALNAVDVPTVPSDYVLAAVGAKGVCEPAALLSAGAGGRIILRKRKNGNVTVAVAEKP